MKCTKEWTKSLMGWSLWATIWCQQFKINKCIAQWSGLALAWMLNHMINPINNHRSARNKVIRQGSQRRHFHHDEMRTQHTRLFRVKIVIMWLWLAVVWRYNNLVISPVNNPIQKAKHTNLFRLMCLSAVTTHARAESSVLGTNTQMLFDTDSFKIGIDNRCSACMSHVRSDFVGELKLINRKVKGFGGSLISNVSVGTIQWRVEDDSGRVSTFTIPNSYYVPEGGVRLLSPQHLAQQLNDNRPTPRGTWCATYGDEVVLYWDQRRRSKTIPMDPSTNVATLRSAPGYTKFQAFCAEMETAYPEDAVVYDSHVIPDEDDDSSVDNDTDTTELDYDRTADHTSQTNPIDKWPVPSCQPCTADFNIDGPNPSTAEKEKPVTIQKEEKYPPTDTATEFLRLHHRMNHISPRRIQQMAKTGMLPAKYAKCVVPKCTSCMFGKATKRPWQTKNPANKNALSKNVKQPGDCVSVDTLESTTPGLIAQLRGNPTKARYHYATIFIDHYSNYSYVHLHQENNGDEVVLAKRAFEQHVRHMGVTVKHYNADNGLFADIKFRQAINTAGQTISFCGVNAHFMNGKAEARIRQLQDLGRTCLIHASNRWPGAITANLWPYAIRSSNDTLNHTPNLVSGRTPVEMFSGSQVKPSMKSFHTLFCPVYTLDSDLASNKGINKWADRSRVGIYLGQSPQHARSVGLVLNLETGLVSPQFHIKFDSTFQTLRNNFEGDIPESKWQQKCHFDKDELKPGGKDKRKKRVRVRLDNESRLTLSRLIPPDNNNNNDPRAPEGDGSEGGAPEGGALDEGAPEGEVPEGGAPEGGEAPGPQPEEEAGGEEDEYVPEIDEEEAHYQRTRTTRSGRTSRPAPRLLEAMETEMYRQKHQVPYELFAVSAEIEDTQHENPLMAYAASADPDTMYYHEAMREPDRAQFEEAMEKEVNSHFDNGTFILAPRSVVPAGIPVVPSVWAMKRKRRLSTGEVYKWKSRLNYDGSKEPYFGSTYSPLASWPSVRMILALAMTHGWKTRQIDYQLAYTQSPIEDEHAYMGLPKGFSVPGGGDPKDYVLHLKKNTYGRKTAGLVWYNNLCKKLAAIGFKKSKHDECIFYRGSCIYVLYCDDSILASPSDSEIDQVIKDLKKQELNLTVEGDIGDFLGVKMEKVNNTINMTQTHLIDLIIKELHLDGPNVSIKDTPLPVGKVVHRFKDSEDFDGHFNYRRTIGRLMYLEKATRPDISAATHMLARHCENPKKEHGKLVKWLALYLRATRDKGVIYNPDPTQSFEVYVDADFSGNWSKDIDHGDDPSSAKSRTGYVVMYFGCPILWASKLQSEISLSSTESEVVALSQSLRETLPLIWLLKEIKRKGLIKKADTPRVHAKLFEDNAGALEICTVPKLRARTKHINTKYFFFRSFVGKEVSIHKISTELQAADYLTKNLNYTLHARHRKKIQGW